MLIIIITDFSVIIISNTIASFVLSLHVLICHYFLTSFSFLSFFDLFFVFVFIFAVFCLCFVLFHFVFFFFLFLFLFYFWLSNYFSNMKRLSLVNCCLFVCLFVYLICFFSWNCWVKIHNLIAFLQFPKIYSFICLLLFSYNFTFRFESYYLCCYSFYYQLILAYLMAVTSQQNVFIASSLGSFLTMPINSGPELCWENTPGCLETFYTLMLSILFLIN